MGIYDAWLSIGNKILGKKLREGSSLASVDYSPSDRYTRLWDLVVPEAGVPDESEIIPGSVLGVESTEGEKGQITLLLKSTSPTSSWTTATGYLIKENLVLTTEIPIPNSITQDKDHIISVSASVNESGQQRWGRSVKLILAPPKKMEDLDSESGDGEEEGKERISHVALVTLETGFEGVETVDVDVEKVVV